MVIAFTFTQRLSCIFRCRFQRNLRFSSKPIGPEALLALNVFENARSTLERKVVLLTKCIVWRLLHICVIAGLLHTPGTSVSRNALERQTKARSGRPIWSIHKRKHYCKWICMKCLRVVVQLTHSFMEVLGQLLDLPVYFTRFVMPVMHTIDDNRNKVHGADDQT